MGISCLGRERGRERGRKRRRERERERRGGMGGRERRKKEGEGEGGRKGGREGGREGGKERRVREREKEKESRPLNSHGATMRLTVSAVISRSHGGGLVSHGLLSLSTSDLPINTTGGFNRFSER